MKNSLRIMIFIILFLFLVIGCAESDDKANTEQPEDVIAIESIDISSYAVVLVEDVSFANAKRFSWHVVINEPVTSEQLIFISERILEEAKNKESFNALTIFYYDYEEYIGYGYVLGRAEFAPGGNWGDADTVETGDYDKMSFSWSLRNKDWSQQLTPEEVKVWVFWNEVFDSLYTDQFFPSDEEVDELVALELDMESEEVNSIMWKHIDWTFLDE